MPTKKNSKKQGPNGYWSHAFAEAYRDALYAQMIEDIEEALKAPEVRQKIREFNQALLAYLLKQKGASTS